MNFRPTRNGPPGKHSAPDDDDSSEREVEQLISFGREYFATDFPNPARVGCPPPAALETLARSRELPDDDLCDHLFGCSECFRAYRAALEAGRATAPAVAVSWRSEWRERMAAVFALKYAFALTVILLAVFGAAWLAWRDKAIPATPRMAQLQPQPPATISSPATEEQPSRNEAPGKRADNRTSTPPRARRAPAAPQVVEQVVEDDMDEFVEMRDAPASGAEAKAKLLRQERSLLKLTLPENSRPGVYHVSIVNAAGQSLRTQRASSADGVNLKLEFDLRGLATGSHYLRLARQGVTLANRPVKIVASK